MIKNLIKNINWQVSPSYFVWLWHYTYRKNNCFSQKNTITDNKIKRKRTNFERKSSFQLVSTCAWKHTSVIIKLIMIMTEHMLIFTGKYKKEINLADHLIRLSHFIHMYMHISITGIGTSVKSLHSKGVSKCWKSAIKKHCLSTYTTIMRVRWIINDITIEFRYRNKFIIECWYTTSIYHYVYE